MKYLLSVLVMLVLSIPVAAQEFTQVRPTIIVSPTGRIIAPIRPIISPTAPIVSSTASIVSPFVIVLPAAPPPLVPPPVRLPPLLLFQTTRGLQGFVIEPPVVLPIGQPTPGLFDGPWPGLWDPR